MIEFFKTWTEGIIVVVFLSIIIEFLLHESKYKKLVNIVTNIYLVFVILNPILNIDLEEFDIESLYENIETEEVSSIDIEKISRDVYLENLKEEIKNLGDQNSVKIENVGVEISDKETGELKYIKVCIRDSEKKELLKKMISEKYNLPYEDVYVEVK